jgi:hypothetical protein
MENKKSEKRTVCRCILLVIFVIADLGLTIYVEYSQVYIYSYSQTNLINVLRMVLYGLLVVAFLICFVGAPLMVINEKKKYGIFLFCFSVFIVFAFFWAVEMQCTPSRSVRNALVVSKENRRGKYVWIYSQNMGENVKIQVTPAEYELIEEKEYEIIQYHYARDNQTGILDYIVE